MNTISTQRASSAGTIAALYARWIDLANILSADTDTARLYKAENPLVDIEILTNRHAEEQIQIMSYLCEIPAQTPTEALMKLSIWRRSNSDTDPIEDFSSRSDYMAYCAYQDLLSITGNWDIATKSDKRHLAR